MKKLITALLLLTAITNSFSAETKLEEVMVGKWKNNIDNEKVKGKMRTGKYGELPPLVDSNVFQVSARTDIDFSIMTIIKNLTIISMFLNMIKKKITITIVPNTTKNSIQIWQKKQREYLKKTMLQSILNMP